MKLLATIFVAFLVIACGNGDENDSTKGTDDERVFAIDVVSFDPGSGAGFGQDRFPDIVLGPPKGSGDAMGSLDTLSLGIEGTIVIELGTPAMDGPGVDLLVFENAFRIGSSTTLYTEPGFVAVSTDGVTFVEFPCDADTTPAIGCAGLAAVFANADENMISPTDVTEAGGDAFDLADIGVAEARYIRIRDAGSRRGHGGINEGFDLDAIAVVH